MEHLIIEETKFTPKVDMSAETGIISIVGKSYPENSFVFYHPVMKWLESYFASHVKSKTIINMEIIYFNSSSSKLFFDFFDVLDEAKINHEIEVNWLYHPENDVAEEAGEDFIEDFEDLNINLIIKE
ncbi:DUF1987 domain-containing protein [Thalassotalea sp. PLHSN55]|uniref:DUF1987 domain-containing protein n=1 Tax=Thalassotalea sp. PLHSN55 TaxID=3435888 RepID=UPI003F839784